MMRPADLDPKLSALLEETADRSGPRLFLPGAGISAGSGIPTFRGAAGYWRIGSRNYHPQELATYDAFRKMPAEVWAWYLYRRSICRRARPNPAHVALAELETRLGDAFLLITQNVDGLHLRAGNSGARTFEIHGNLDFIRCAAECTPELRPAPDTLLGFEKGQDLDARARELLTCPQCGDWQRPHVLWFDECYDEERFRLESSENAAVACSILVIVGTSGTTNLPTRIARIAAARDVPVIVVDQDPNQFADLARNRPQTYLARGDAVALLPAITAALSLQ